MSASLFDSIWAYCYYRPHELFKGFFITTSEERVDEYTRTRRPSEVGRKCQYSLFKWQKHQLSHGLKRPQSSQLELFDAALNVAENEGILENSIFAEFASANSQTKEKSQASRNLLGNLIFRNPTLIWTQSQISSLKSKTLALLAIQQ
jgi:hypothetical protein